MWFNNINIKRVKRKYKRLLDSRLQSFIIYAWIGFLTFIFIFFIFVYFKFIKGLPDIEKLEQIEIKESSVIYDKDWNQLYTLSWDEKRTYVNYQDISKNMINAIVAWEDKTFFQNSWLDMTWLIRSVLNYVTWKSDVVKWTSTLSQQLIKNTFLNNERSFERKIKEAYLSYELNKNYSKTKILELYLNKIGFWSNAYWVQQASLTFFNKKINNVNILESSILASIPKWPTYYSPYNHPDRLLGYVYKYNKDNDKNVTKIISNQDYKEYWDLVLSVKTIINKLKWSPVWENWLLLCWIDNTKSKKSLSLDSDWCSLVKYDDLYTFLNNIRLDLGWEYLEYQAWRKDFILWRMLEDWYISFDEYKKALLDWFGFQFYQYRENIKYPHFVMYIKEYLSAKYWEELIQWWGLKIYTTLDSKLQNKAEELVKTQVAANKKKFNANNWALISIDNKNWDILAFVGWADYFNKDIDGNVNMITSKRQPWSTFKPFVYALAIDKKAIGPLTPIYDLKTTFPWNYEPKNFDWKFMWKMTVMTALNYSRNIPAIKAYFLAWEQKEIVSYMKKAWVKSLNENFYYWAPLALWAWEMTPLELAWAYSVFANLWNKVEINPIQKILDSRWLVIEEKKQSAWNKVLDEKTAYIINTILSNTNYRPSAFWNNALTLNGRTVAAKTWTSNKLFVKNGKKTIYPWDLWTAWYTPQITTVVWVWNTNWKQMDMSWDWLNWAAPIWKQFMEYAHLYKEKQNWIEPKWVIHASISKLSWLLAPSWFDPSFIVSTIFKNKPTKYDTSLKNIEVDEMCNGKVSDKTPAWAIKSWYYVALTDIDPNNKSWQASVDARVKNGWGVSEFENIPNLITYYQDKECERSDSLVNNSNITVSTNLKDWDLLINWNNSINIDYKSKNPLRKLQVLIGERVIQEIDIENEKSWTYQKWITIPSWYEWEYQLTIRAIDSIYYSWEVGVKVNISQKDNISPVINITNPTKWSISIYEDQFFNLRWNISDNSNIKSINLYIDDKPYNIWLSWKDLTVEINKATTIPVWVHKLKIEAIDFFFNKSEKIIDLEIMKR